MYQSLKVGVIIPAHNEERLISCTLKSVPSFVDVIYVIDDGSKDRTSRKVLQCAESDSRISLISHRSNQGVGAAIITGYNHAYKNGCDVFVVVGGDAQMDWNDLENLLAPIKSGIADYTKGNRFIYGKSKDTPGNAWYEMPPLRILGNVILSILTRLASGYHNIFDSQMGYTAMHRRVFPLIDWKKARRGYGYPADWLIRFHSKGIRALDVPVRAVYLAGERQTQIKIRRFIVYMLGIIIRGGLSRVYHTYVRNIRKRINNVSKLKRAT